MGTKICSKCKQVKEVSEFNKWKNANGDGYQTFCRECSSAYSRVYKSLERNKLNRRKERSNPIKKAKEDAQRKFYRQTKTVNYLFATAKARARKYNIPFTITKDDIIVVNICPILKVPMTYGTAYTHSLDKIDSTKGYVPGNIQVISLKANMMKSNASFEELLNFSNFWIAQQGGRSKI